MRKIGIDKEMLRAEILPSLIIFLRQEYRIPETSFICNYHKPAMCKKRICGH